MQWQRRRQNRKRKARNKTRAEQEMQVKTKRGTETTSKLTERQARHPEVDPSKPTMSGKVAKETDIAKTVIKRDDSFESGVGHACPASADSKSTSIPSCSPAAASRSEAS